MSFQRCSLAWLLAFVVVQLPRPALSGDGATLTPDLGTYLVSKDLGAERWSVSVNLASLDPSTVLNVSGTVFRTDGGPVKFVVCQVREDSTGSLEVADSEFRLRCKGRDACPEGSSDCAQRWVLISEDVAVPTSFFLPSPGGEPSERVLASRPYGVASSASVFSFDGTSFLVSKDLQGERWSINLNSERDRFSRRVLKSLTGNVFRGDGQAPSFVSCEIAQSSRGTLAEPESLFRFDCSGTDACVRGDPEDCARVDWRPIGAVDIPAGFFIPPDVPDLVPIARVDDPGSIDAILIPRLVDCSKQNEQCAERIGRCEIQGTVRVVAESPNGDPECQCVPGEVPQECTSCASAEDGPACGSACAVQTPSGYKDGICLPDGDGGCGCWLGFECSGPDGACGDGTCCLDDALDECDAASGDVGCLGVCLETDDLSCPVSPSSR
jgi:hypothetical protein